MSEETGIEEWRAFREGTYEASSAGNIRRAKPGISTFVGRPVRPVCGPTGYGQVQLSNERFYIHRVIAETFLGPCPTGHVVNHKDFDRQNNALSNLEYCSSKLNARHARDRRTKGPTKPRAPLKGKQIGDRHWMRRMPEKIMRGEQLSSKTTEDDVIAIRYLVATGRTQSSVAKRFRLSVAQVSRIIRRTRWAHIPDRALVTMTMPSWLARRAK